MKAKPWRVIRSVISFKDRWLTLRSDECETPSGHILPSYHVLEYPDWINIVAVTADGKLLLVREYRHGAGEVVTGLVSGTVDPEDGDTSVRALVAAQRELIEETGYGGGAFRQIFVTYPNPASQNNVATSFLATELLPVGDTSFDASEEIDLLFEDYADVLARLQSGELMMQAMHVAALWSAAQLIASGAVAVDPTLRQKIKDFLVAS